MVGAPQPIYGVDDGGYLFSLAVKADPDVNPKVCVGETRSFTFLVTYDAYYQSGSHPHGETGLTIADLVIKVDGQTVFHRPVQQTTLEHHFDRPGTVVITSELPISAVDWIRGINTAGTQTTVRVVTCHYEVQTGAIVHLNDGGFQPVLGATIDSAILTPDPVEEGRFKGDAEMSNVAVAFPYGGCLPSFTVPDIKAHLRGSLSNDGQTFHLGIVWARGTAGFAGTGVRCGIRGGTRNDFKVRPLSIDLPAGGVPLERVEAKPFTVTTRGKSYTGSIYVTLKRIMDD